MLLHKELLVLFILLLRYGLFDLLFKVFDMIDFLLDNFLVMVN